MIDVSVRPAGSTFRRIGGREGRWMLPAHREDPSVRLRPDDEVVCPFDFLEVAGEVAEAAISELRDMFPGKTPMLFGSPHEAGILFERRRNRGKPAEHWLRKADTFDLDGWRRDRAALFRSYGDVPRRGPWPSEVRTYRHLTVPLDLLDDDKPYPSVIIGLLPTSDPTETAAHLGFGYWNDCPPVPVHVLLARRWRERYGAVQVTNTYETVEFQVAKPLADREEALQLASDQLYWCSDSVPETLEHAAAELIGSSVWVFWWD